MSKEQTKTKHTPGPWRNTSVNPKENQEGYQIHAGNNCIATCHYGTGNIDHHIQLANSRLIAAAPELLEALNEIMDGYIEKNGEFLHAMNERAKKQMHNALYKAKQAIAKAEGTQNENT